MKKSIKLIKGSTKFGTLMLVSLAAVTLYMSNTLIKQTQIFFTEATGSGNTYYVSQTGSDTNPGTIESPFKTLDFAWRKLSPGDTLLLRAGTYKEKLHPNTNGTSTGPITISSYPGDKVVIDGTNTIDRPLDILGSYTVVKNLEIINAKWACAVLSGSYNTVENLTVHECYSHGIYTETANHTIRGNTVYNTNLINKNRDMTSGWGSAIKLKMGGNNSLVENNTVYNNYGEGIAATRVANAIIRNNFYYDNYYANIYVDNSYSTKVLSNLSSCTSNTQYDKVLTRDADGNPLTFRKPAAIALAEEYYSGWGNKLHDIQVQHNIGSFCGNGLAYWGADSGTGGMRDVTITNNTLFGGTRSVISIGYEANSSNVVIANNIFHSPSAAPWVENTTGITLRDNFWVGALPSTSTNARGTNDVAGSITFATQPPRYNQGGDYRVVSSTPTFATGFYGATELHSTTAPSTTPNPTSTPISTITPTPTPTPPATSTPAATPTPTPTPVTTLNLTPSITSTSLGNGLYRTDYSSPISGTDPNPSDTLSFTASGLPRGLSINSCTQSVVNGIKELKCRISGKPRSRGSYNVKLTLKDNQGATHTQQYTVTIN